MLSSIFQVEMLLEQAQTMLRADYLTFEQTESFRAIRYANALPLDLHAHKTDSHHRLALQHLASLL